MRRTLFSAILVLITLATLVGSMTPHAFSQSYVTTSTSTIIQSNGEFVSGYGQYCYYQDVQLQQGLVGTELFGTLTTTNPIIFYILSSSQLSGYLSATGVGKGGTACSRLSPPSAHLTVHVSNSYSMDWTVPDSDTYYFVFANPGTANAYVLFTCWSQQIVTVTPQVYTTPTYAQYTTPTVQPTSAELQTNTSNPPTGSNPYFTAIEIGIIALIVVGAALAYIYAGKKRPTNQTAERSSEKPTSKILETQESKPSVIEHTKAKTKANLEKQFCLECGNELPVGSKFCNKCGSKQR